MKELEKTKRISISAILFLLVLVVGFVTIRKPDVFFTKDSDHTLQFLNDDAYIIQLDSLALMEKGSYLLIDNRSNFEYTKGHMVDAVNIPQNQILKKEYLDVIKNAAANNKTIIIYNETPEIANNSCLLLYQLGIENLKLLAVDAYYQSETFKIVDNTIEDPLYDYAQTMKEAGIAPVKKIIQKQKTLPQKKKVVTKPKKKKKMPEGGC
ncbi:rhodanese-like domain-containing protein [Lutimonas saemankumensis]|uniref:rhodanese-like domain-containing protein n=1 Tax=Lutimonas saemankumensis TaxID=483016 RepID=UPI001CD3F886|nr:rhodanese-like domain-containing protein [Lutimonas saemankumensis]MCA0932303.1 rhodanese-like domain-containing protein [Lutimonas saemankumensis]